MSFVFSPLLYATPFVGAFVTNKNHANQIWLNCAESGFAFCTERIDKSFGEIRPGEVLRIEISEGYFKGAVSFPLTDATCISKCADAMLGELFKAEYGTDAWDDAVRLEYRLDPDMDLEEGIPEELDIYYRVRRV